MSKNRQYIKALGKLPIFTETLEFEIINLCKLRKLNK